MFHPFEIHAQDPYREGHVPEGAVSARAGSVSECGREVIIYLSGDEERILEAGFKAEGCSAMTAVGSAVCSLVEGMSYLEAGMVGPDAIGEELGGLTSKRYAAEFASDAFHWSLGTLISQAKIRGDRVGIALSGGVDSALAAHLLQEAGEECVAITVELWRDNQTDAEKSCCSASAVRLARQMAHKAGMPHFTLDLRDSFRAGVVDPWVESARQGQTANPCVSCNGHVRIDGMLDSVRLLGCNRLATGHYTLLERDEEGALLRINPDARRDQSYMLAAIKPSTLACMVFPLGGRTKDQVRSLAREAGIVVADRPDSQDLCFLSGEGKAGFLTRYGKLSGGGDIVSQEGTVLGRHEGSHLYTLGQRRGLGIGGFQEPLRVTNIEGDQVTVGSREDMLTDSIIVRGVNLWRGGGEVAEVRLRSHGSLHTCRVETLEGELPEAGRHNKLRVIFEESVERPSPGQSACLLSEGRVVGQGTIAPSRPGVKKGPTLPTETRPLQMA